MICKLFNTLKTYEMLKLRVVIILKNLCSF